MSFEELNEKHIKNYIATYFPGYKSAKIYRVKRIEIVSNKNPFIAFEIYLQNLFSSPYLVVGKERVQIVNAIFPTGSSTRKLILSILSILFYGLVGALPLVVWFSNPDYLILGSIIALMLLASLSPNYHYRAYRGLYFRDPKMSINSKKITVAGNIYQRTLYLEEKKFLKLKMNFII